MTECQFRFVETGLHIKADYWAIRTDLTVRLIVNNFSKKLQLLKKI